MRLSYTQISLLHLFLITFLTLFLKLDAKAQSMLAVNLTRNHFEHDKYLVDVADENLIQPQSTTEKHDEGVVNEGYPTTINFPHTNTLLLSIQNARRIYTEYHPLHVRIYSASIQHSMRITVKLFKVVIVPLWYARGAGR